MSSLGVKPVPPAMNPRQEDEDDWETDPDFLNTVNEKESRWGAKTVAGSGHQESIRLDKLREEVMKGDQIAQERKLAQMPRASEGYGGKFGVQNDRVDHCAVGFEYKGKVEAHASQRDYSHGFGGTFGVQKDRVDKSAVGWDSHEKVEKHESQKDYKMGFGGQFGVQSDRKDKSAAGWDEREEAAKHESQTDYKKGFGGQFGIQSDRKDKSALGWEEHEKVEKHESQTDYKKGFGGQFGVQSDRQDKSALGWEEREKLQSHESQIDYKKGFGGQFGVQTDRKDKTAHGWEEHEKVEKHESQTDYKKGFGGQFGVQTDRKDKTAHGWEEREKMEQHESQTDYKKGFGGQFGVLSDRQDKSAHGWDEKQKGGEGAEDEPKAGAHTQKMGTQTHNEPIKGAAKSLRSKFEQMAMQGDQLNMDRAREERERRKREDEQLRQRQAEEERQRQLRLEEQWAKQSEEGDEEGEKGDEQQQQQPRQRPTIGIRLPYATSAAVPLPDQHQRLSRLPGETATENESTSVADIEVDEPQHPPPVKVLPTAAEISQHKLAMGGGVTHEGKTHRNSNTKTEVVEEGEKLRDSGEWADETANPTSQQLVQGHVEQQQKQHHHYELPPIVDDEVPNVLITSNSSAGNGLPNHKSPENDQNMPPPADPTPAVTEPPAASECTASTTAVALFEYERQDDDEIGFEVNDIITDIEQIDVGWWRGASKGRFGLFPANYVQLIERK